jgi:hypothetical protein
MQVQMDKTVLRTLFYDQIKNSPVMREDVAHYDRCLKDHPDKNYDWLVQRVRAYLYNKRRVDNREKQITGTTSGASGSAAPAPDKNQGRGSGGGRGSGDSAMTCSLCNKVGHLKKDCWTNPKVVAAKAAGRGNASAPSAAKSRAQSPKGRGRGRGRGAGAGDRTPSPEVRVYVCWGFNRGTCKTTPCPKGHEHREWTVDEKARADRVTRAGSPAAKKAAAAPS